MAEAAKRRSPAMTLCAAKRRIALLIALADLGGVFDGVATTRALSRAADALVGTALRVALRLAGDKLNWAGPSRTSGVAGSPFSRSASMARASSTIRPISI